MKFTMTLHYRPNRAQRKLRKRGSKPDSSPGDEKDRNAVTPPDAHNEPEKLGFLARRGWGSQHKPARGSVSLNRARDPSSPYEDAHSISQKGLKPQSHASWHTIPPSQDPTSCYSQPEETWGMHVPSISVPPSANVDDASPNLPSSSPRGANNESGKPALASSRRPQCQPSGSHPLCQPTSGTSCSEDENQPVYLQHTEKVSFHAAYARLSRLTCKPSPLNLNDDSGGLRGLNSSRPAVRDNGREGATSGCEKKVVIDEQSVITLHCGDDIYQIVGHISTGGYGTVLAAQDKDGSAVAIKVVRKATKDDDDVHRKLQENEFTVMKEATKARRSGMMNLLASWSDATNIYFVMPLYPYDLHTAILSGPLSRIPFMTIAADLVYSLCSLHEMGYIHRDIKPSNVLITEDGHAVLTDFGMVYRMSIVYPGTAFSCGTKGYTAPELISPTLFGSPYYGHHADVWSLAVVLLDVYSDYPVYIKSGLTPSEIELDLLKTDPRTLPHMQSIYHRNPELYDLLSKMLVRDPRERYSAKQCKAHAFFKNVDWDALQRRKMTRPYYIHKQQIDSTVNVWKPDVEPSIVTWFVQEVFGTDGIPEISYWPTSDQFWFRPEFPVGFKTLGAWPYSQHGHSDAMTFLH